MKKWSFPLAIALLVASASAQIEMTARSSVVNYQYIYGGGPFTFPGGERRERTSASISDTISAFFSESNSGDYLGMPWSGAVAGTLDAAYEIEGTWGAATGITVSHTTTISALAGGQIGTAQAISANPGNTQSFTFTVSIPQDFLLFGFIDHAVPPAWNPAGVSLELWTGFSWLTVATASGTGMFTRELVLGPGSYRLVSHLSCGLTVAASGPSSGTYHMTSNYQAHFAPVGRAVEGVVQLQQWLGAIAGESIRYSLWPVGAGPGQVGAVSLNNVGQFSIPIGPSMKPGTYTLWMKGRKWQAKLTTVQIPMSGVGQAGALLLRAGDADDSNTVDSDDYDILISSYGELPGNPGYDERADFDGVNGVDSDDFDILVEHFGEQGDPE